MHTLFLTKIYDGEKTASSTNVARKSGYLPIKNETRSMPITLYEYKLEVD
jgi:hypothetical protein